MSGPTVSSMHDARDAEDNRLLDSGEVTLLVESYYGVILDRCRPRLRPEDAAIGVAAEVAIRLLELMRKLRIRKALAFDGDFAAAGFVELRP